MISRTHKHPWARFAALTALAGTSLVSAGPAQAQQVYVGVADQWNDLLAHGDQWQYVRQNADGFYVNFIEMDWVLKKEHAMTQGKLAQTAALFHHKNAYYESDMHETVENEQASIAALQAAGFTIPYTSLNYGWSAPRAETLKTYRLRAGQPPRLNFVQDGPWTIAGDITSDGDPHPVFTNKQYRNWVKSVDGISTDGPLGLWQSDQGGMRHGSFSMVKFAHGLHKQAMVMLCPYGAGVPTYDPSLFLQTAQDCVHQHEDADALPDIWAVFEYATSIAAVPEQKDGKPFNSTTGVAYWLLHHIQDPDHQAHLDVTAERGMTVHQAPPVAGVPLTRVSVPVSAHGQTSRTRTVTCTLQNDSDWLDFCPVVRARQSDLGRNWTVRCVLDGKDVSNEMLHSSGLVCVGPRRLLPATKRTLQISLTCKRLHDRASAKTLPPVEVVLELLSHPSRTKQVHRRIVLHVS